MAKKKEEVKEVENKKEKTCDCGEECKCKKGKARRVIVTFLLIVAFSVIAFGFGVATGGVILVGEDKTEVDNKDDVKEEGNENKIETIKIGDVELYSYKTQLKTDNIPSFDSAEAVEAFIDTSNYFTDGELRDALLDGNEHIPKSHFKLAYILTALEGGGFYYIDKSYLGELASKIFSDGLEFIPYSGSLYYSASDIIYMCNSDICIIEQTTGGGGGADLYQTKVVGTKKIGENTIYTIQEYYDEFEGGIYTDYEGDLICEKDCAEDIFKAYGDKLNTYEMTFDKNNRYVSSKKVK